MHEPEAILNRLSHMLDHSLPSLERVSLAADIDRYPQQRPLFDAMIKVDSVLRAAPMLAPRHDLTHSIVQRLESHHHRDRRVLGLTMFLGGSLSLVPSLLVAAVLVLGVFSLLSPEGVRIGVNFFSNVVSTVYAFIHALGTLQDVLTPWGLPLLAAMFGTLLLTVTLLWATRITLIPHVAEA